MPLESWNDPAPPGIYECKIRDAKEGQSKSSGNDQFTVELSIAGGWADVRDWISIGGPGIKYGIIKLQAFGLSKADLPLDERKLRGRKAIVAIKAEEYTDRNGNVKIQAKVDQDQGDNGYWKSDATPEGLVKFGTPVDPTRMTLPAPTDEVPF